MSRCKGAEIKVCNLKWIKQGQKSTIPPFPEEFLMWKWFDKYIVRNPEMDSFSMYSNILEIPRIGRLFGRSKKFRNSQKFREKAQEFFKLTFKVNTFKLKLENNEVSVISKISDYEKLNKSLKGFYVKIHPAHVKIFKRYEYSSLVEDNQKNTYAMFGPLSYANHSCSAVIRISPPTVCDTLVQPTELNMPFLPNCLNSCVLSEENSVNIRSVVVGESSTSNIQMLQRERKYAENKDLNPFGKRYKLSGMDFLNACDNAVCKGKEFLIRYANYIPRTWFSCRCEPENYCCQYDYRYTKKSKETHEVDQPSLKRRRF
jgi:hypothetical protein